MAKAVYLCGECLYVYTTKKSADTCEQWCRKHKSCNTEIIKKAVGVVHPKGKF
jgi:hypothetical protein